MKKIKKISIVSLLFCLTTLPQVSFSGEVNPTVAVWQAQAHWGAVTSIKLQNLIPSTTVNPWSWVTTSAIVFPMYGSGEGGSTVRASTLWTSKVTNLEGESDASLSDAFTTQKSARVANLYVNSKMVNLGPPSPTNLIMTGENLDPAKIAAAGAPYDYVIVDLPAGAFCGVNLKPMAYQALMNK